jgi:hypothetical protein
MTSIDQELPEHVRRIIDRDGSIDFTPPSFERWLGRLVMLRTLASMLGFATVGLLSFDGGAVWETAAVHGIIAAIVFYFFAWAAGLFVFGELYDAEIKRARESLEEQERDRARRIEEYYRERLRAQAAGDETMALHAEPSAEDLAQAVTQQIRQPGAAAASPPPSVANRRAAA